MTLQWDDVLWVSMLQESCCELGALIYLCLISVLISVFCDGAHPGAWSKDQPPSSPLFSKETQLNDGPKSSLLSAYWIAGVTQVCSSERPARVAWDGKFQRHAAPAPLNTAWPCGQGMGGKSI